MPRPKASAWTRQELALLDELYPQGGLQAVTDSLPDRSWRAIQVMAHKRGLRAPVVQQAPKGKLQGEQLEEAIRLREQDRWSFARIGALFGISESSASNAVISAQCVRQGFTPAQRDENGRLTPEGLERLRLALRRGMKGIDIQLRLGLSASRIAEERRRYSADLKARGKAPLPAPGAGELYSGAKLSRERRRQVEALLQEGYGTLKVHERTGASKTTVTRIRARLVRQLKRKGQALPGCDLDGRRISQKDSVRFIPEEARTKLRGLLLARVPVSRAARECGIGSCSAYRIRDELSAELAASGAELPKPRLPGRVRPGALPKAWLPTGAANIYRYRQLSRTHGPDEARRLIECEMAEQERAEAERRRAEATRPLTFEEKLARVREGKAAVAPVLRVPSRAPDMTLGGVATGAL